jgi:hypothetical protein
MNLEIPRDDLSRYKNLRIICVKQVMILDYKIDIKLPLGTLRLLYFAQSP